MTHPLPPEEAYAHITTYLPNGGFFWLNMQYDTNSWLKTVIMGLLFALGPLFEDTVGIPIKSHACYLLRTNPSHHHPPWKDLEWTEGPSTALDHASSFNRRRRRGWRWRTPMTNGQFLFLRGSAKLRICVIPLPSFLPSFLPTLFGSYFSLRRRWFEIWKSRLLRNISTISQNQKD